MPDVSDAASDAQALRLPLRERRVQLALVAAAGEDRAAQLSELFDNGPAKALRPASDQGVLPVEAPSGSHGVGSGLGRVGRG